MATTDPTSPILYQKSHHEYPTINNITLEQVFEDGTSLKVKVPQYIPHEQGILFFLTETLPEFVTRTTNTLLYDGHDYFDHFPEVQRSLKSGGRANQAHSQETTFPTLSYSPQLLY
jgi:hypothetical protein